MDAKIKNIFNKLLIISFIFLIYSPYLGSLLGISSNFDNIERRSLAQFPILNLKNTSVFPTQLNAYFNDYFGFRNLMLRTYQFIKVNILDNKFVFINNRAIVEHGWTMEIGGITGSLNDYYSHPLFSADELSQIKNYLESERGLLAKKKTPYLVVIAPHMQSVYPERFPFAKDHLFSLKLSQLTDYLRKNSNLEILDLREALQQAKSDKIPLYYQTDSHWNNYGAFIGYQEVMQRFIKYRPDYTPLQRSDFDILVERYDIWGGDDVLKFPGAPGHPDFGVKFTLKNNPTKKGTVLTLGDSFMQIKRTLPKYYFVQLFPELKDNLQLLFKNPNDHDLLPKVNIEELIPQIKKNIPDQTLQDRLIKFLVNSGIKSDDLEGIGFFLQYNFDHVVFEDKFKTLGNTQLEELQPDLVIRETEQVGLTTLTPGLNIK